MGFASAGDDASAGLTWGKPSPDVAIKAAAIKTLAQALVSEDASASPQEDVAGVASSFAVELGELCELDPTTPAFQGFRWRLLQVKWLGQERANSAASSGGSSGSGRKRKASEYDADDPEVVDPNDFTEEEREALVRDTQEASPDAGWVRLAAASALFRLFRGYNKTLTGNEYVVMGLSCQDKLVEVRRALIDKITAGVAHFLTVQGKPQRAAKLAALYALYAADPDEHNVQLAYARLREYAVSRRAEVDRKAMALASEEQEVILFNSMPDLILPSLVFFAAHHPDYDNQAVFQDDTAFLDLFQRCFQMALEVLMLPDAAVAGSSEAMVEVSRRVGAVQKLLRRLKYCKVLSIDVSEEDDPVATTSAHQLCDIALLLVKQLIQWAAAGQTLPLQKFGGKVVLPKGCFKGETGLEREGEHLLIATYSCCIRTSNFVMQSSFRSMRGSRSRVTCSACLSDADKRTDGCGLPPSYHPVLEEPLFSAAYGIASPAMKPRPKGRSKPREQVVEQNQQAGGDLAPGTVAKKAAAPKRRPAGAAAKEKAQPKRRPKLIKAVASPVRHQPRRGAKDVAEDKLRDMELDGDEGSTLSTDAEANESESDQPAVRGALLKVAGTVPDLRATSSGEEGSSEEDAGFIDSPGQENGNRLNTKAAGLGAKAVKPAAAAAKPRAKRAKA